MAKPNKARCIGILTAGGDCPGLNAAIRGVAKAAISGHGMKVVGIYDGFRGLIENRTVVLDNRSVSGILTLGGTLLGTSRDKPHKIAMGGKVRDMTSVAVENARRLGIDCLVCLGGNGTQKNALHLAREGGLNVVTLPKTIDNDVACTDLSFGFDTAMGIATEAIDRLHTTATSHNRMIVCEVMGHKAGWLALGAGLAGGADVILIPELPYDLHRVAEHLVERKRSGKRFSIICVAEAAHAIGEEDAAQAAEAARARNDHDAEGRPDSKRHKKDSKGNKHAKKSGRGADDGGELLPFRLVQEAVASRLARQLQQLTGTEARVTSLGHVQRGGSPTPTDRLLCTRLGVAAADLVASGQFNVMVAVRGNECVPVPLEETASRVNVVPADHAWLRAAREVGTCLGEP